MHGTVSFFHNEFNLERINNLEKQKRNTGLGLLQTSIYLLKSLKSKRNRIPVISRTLFNYTIYIFHRVYIFIPMGHLMKLLRWNVQRAYVPRGMHVC